MLHNRLRVEYHFAFLIFCVITFVASVPLRKVVVATLVANPVLDQINSFLVFLGMCEIHVVEIDTTWIVSWNYLSFASKLLAW